MPLKGMTIYKKMTRQEVIEYFKATDKLLNESEETE